MRTVVSIAIFILLFLRLIEIHRLTKSHSFHTIVSWIFVFVSADDCSDLTGKWYNSLGSELYISSHDDATHRIAGEYRTAVERNAGAAGGSYSIIAGKTGN